LKNAHFSYPPPFNHEFENIPFELDRRNFACKSFPLRPTV